jgi:hypothetical protein
MVAWDWLNKRPTLPPECLALLSRYVGRTLQKIRQRGDIGLIASCLHIVWSEWCNVWDNDVSMMHRVIREELGGVGAAGHRTELVRRLDHVLSQLGQGQGCVDPNTPIGRESLLSAKRVYEEFRKELLEADGGQ